MPYKRMVIIISIPKEIWEKNLKEISKYLDELNSFLGNLDDKVVMRETEI